MRTAVVILNWNGRDFLEKFLPGLVKSLQGYDAEVVIADNASTDGSQELLAEKFPDVRLIQFDKNYGFTGGYNKAFKELMASFERDAENRLESERDSESERKSKRECERECENDSLKEGRPEFFLLLNSDIEVTEDWLYPLEEWMTLHEECAACGPKLHSYQEREMFEYAGAAGGFLDLFGFPFCRGRVMKRVAKDDGQYDSPEDVLWATGACLMVRSSVWEELGGLDDRFFAHMEEIEFCWRARLAGYSVNVVPRSLVYHVGGGTLPQDSPFKLHLNYRNNLLMLGNNLAKSVMLRNFFDVLSTTAPELAVCTDDFTNCMEVYNEMSETLQKTVVESCVVDAMKTARRRLRMRMLLDDAAGIVYLCQGKKEYRNAVRAAHKEYRELKSNVGYGELRDLMLEEIRNDFPVARKMLTIDLNRKRTSRVKFVGIIDEMIIPLAFVARERIFEVLEEIMN